VTERNDDHRADAVPGADVAVGADVALHVVAQDGLVVGERPTGDAAGDREAGAFEFIVARQRLAEDAGVRAEDEPVALQDHDRGSVAPDQRFRAPADQGHHGHEVEVGGCDVTLDIDDLGQAIGLSPQRQLGELALADVLEDRDRRPGRRTVVEQVLDQDPAPDRLAVAADVTLLDLVRLALHLIELVMEDGGAAVVRVRPPTQVVRSDLRRRIPQHPHHRGIHLDRAGVEVVTHDARRDAGKEPAHAQRLGTLGGRLIDQRVFGYPLGRGIIPHEGAIDGSARSRTPARGTGDTRNVGCGACGASGGSACGR
jgi:hypothetical protein